MTTAPARDLERDIPAGPDEVWYTRCPVPTAFEVAEARGLFDRELAPDGLRWLPLAGSADPAVHQSHFTHRKARSFRHGGNVPAIVARARGADTRVIGVSWLRTSYPILGLPGSGIRTVEDLRGRRLLLPRRRRAAVDFWAASTLRVFENALATAGLTLDDVNLVETEAEDDLIPAAGHAQPADRLRWTLHNAYRIQRDVLLPLVRGEVDAVSSQASLGVQLQALTGARVVFEQADQPRALGRANNGAPDVVTVSGRLLDDQPEVVARVLACILEGAAWAAANPEESFALLADRVQIQGALLEATYGRDIAAQLALTPPADAVDVLADQQDHLLRHGFIEEPFDVEAWVCSTPFARAREILAERGGP